MGCDFSQWDQVEAIDYVSIHAPAWGATHVRKGRFVRNDGFNPRTRVGCDIQLALMLPHVHLFQSTHPRGVRPASVFLCGDRSTCFNPRTRVGCDARLVMIKPGYRPVSIHAPAWGATRTLSNTVSSRLCFNPRTRVGCDAPALVSSSTYPAFQSTHPRGVRL